MNSDQLVQALTKFATLDAAAQSCSESVRALARAIQEASGVADVEIACATIEPGESAPSRESRAFRGSARGALAEEIRVQELSLAGERAVLGDLRPLTWEWKERAGSPRVLVVRVRLSTLLGWAIVEPGPAGLDAEPWARALSTALGVFARTAHVPGAHGPRARQRRFFDALLDWTHARVDTDLAEVCKAWRRAALADGAVMWTYLPAVESYEMVAYDLAATDAKRERLSFFQPNKRVPRGFGVGHLASVRARPVRVDDVSTWREEHAGETYRVLMADDLAASGCRSLVCVPLLGNTAPDAPRAPLRVVTLHFCTQPMSLMHSSDDALLDMGRASREFLRASAAARKLRVHERLRELVEHHLVRADAPPRVVRGHYLDGLIQLVRDELEVDGASIFLRARFGDSVECVGSTGLQDANGRPIPTDELAACTYAPGEGWTGECFATGRAIVYPSSGREPAHRPKFTEALRESPVDPDVPALLQPIPAGTAATTAAFGVIRCIGPRARLFGGRYAEFRPPEIELASFIAAHVSQVVQTLTQRVAREEAIGIIKHELRSPLGMIRDTSRKILRDLEERRPAREVDARDVEVCAALALNLTQQLDADGRPMRAVAKSPVLLEGEIVARVRSMLSHYAREANGMSIRFGDGFRQIPAVLVDREMIEQALLNLIVNAVKYGKRGSLIEIEARPPDSNPRFYIVDVINQGLGVEEEEKEKIFLPQYRSPRARRMAAPGVGLGLAIARQALRAHGGDVYLTAPRDPTIFSIYIPR